MSDRYDLLVVGGGPAGYVAAIRAAQLGKKVACIEKERAGGICLNWGCIPTKSLLRNAELYQLIQHRAGDFGFKINGDLSYDWQKIIGRSQKVADQLAGGIESLFRKNKVDYVVGEGTISAPDSVSVRPKEGEGRTLRGKNILVSTGVRPRPLPGLPFNGTTVLSSREAMSLPKQPASMVIIGAGAIGVEFAYFYNAFGTKVTLVEMMPHILPVEDQEISQALERSFQRQGIKMLLGTKFESGKTSSKGVELKLSGAQTETIKADVALVAIGVEALLPPGLSFTLERGFIKVNERYETSVRGIYAAGDVIGPPWLAHVASYEAIQAVEGLYTDRTPKRVTIFPGCTYCQPQVASIGLTEQAAREQGKQFRVGRFPFRASGKALAVGEADGFVKLVIGQPLGEILGAHIIGAEATELIAELGVAMTLEATYEEIEATIHAHPTLSEAVHEATAAAFGEAIHI
ncbi:MAG: dihydrolipoyl dehydrogenase [Acidobacteriota bacterium]